MVIRPTVAPLRSTSVLVATVDPWITRSVSPRNRSSDNPCAAAASCKPAMTPMEGSSGVVAVLKKRGWPVSPATTKSVKVPPTSIPILYNLGLLIRFAVMCVLSSA